MRNIIEIDKKALKDNYNFYRQKTLKKVISVIKTNAYGHGIKECYKVLKEAGCDFYAVATLEEAKLVSSFNGDDNILLLSVVENEELSEIEKRGIIVTIASIEQLKMLIDSPYNIRAHLKINTGMYRIGIQIDEFNQAIKMISEAKNIKLEGIFTHHATSVLKDIKKQHNLFVKTIGNLDTKDLLIHESNSVSCLIFKENFTNAVRIGAGLYGVKKIVKEMDELVPILYLYSYVKKVIPINKNVKVGYDYMFKSKKEGFVIVLPIGYGDGYILKTNGYAYFEGDYLPQISKVCMDYTMFFSSKRLLVNDKVEIFGKNVLIDNLSVLKNTSACQTVTMLNDRIKRKVI